MLPDLIPLFVVLIVFGSGALVIKWILDYFRDKNRVAGSNRSLPVSELQAIIAEAVDEATEPVQAEVEALRERVRTLEAQLKAEQTRGPLLGEHAESSEEAAVNKTMGPSAHRAR